MFRCYQRRLDQDTGVPWSDGTREEGDKDIPQNQPSAEIWDSWLCPYLVPELQLVGKVRLGAVGFPGSCRA